MVKYRFNNCSVASIICQQFFSEKETKIQEQVEQGFKIRRTAEEEKSQKRILKLDLLIKGHLR